MTLASSLAGIFNPVLNGTYVFHIYAKSDGRNGVMLLKQNNEVICRVHVSTADYTAGACSTIVRLPLSIQAIITP